MQFPPPPPKAFLLNWKEWFQLFFSHWNRQHVLLYSKRATFISSHFITYPVRTRNQTSTLEVCWMWWLNAFTIKFSIISMLSVSFKIVSHSPSSGLEMWETMNTTAARRKCKYQTDKEKILWFSNLKGSENFGLLYPVSWKIKLNKCCKLLCRTKNRGMSLCYTHTHKVLWHIRNPCSV